jgi:hypothetical protein
MRVLFAIAAVVVTGCTSHSMQGRIGELVCEVHGLKMSSEKVSLLAAKTTEEMNAYLSAKVAFPNHGGTRYFPLPLVADAPVCPECTKAFSKWSDGRKKTPNQSLQPTALLGRG